MTLSMLPESTRRAFSFASTNHPREFLRRGGNADVPQPETDTHAEGLAVSLPKGPHGIQFQGQPARLERIRLFPKLPQAGRDARRLWLGKVVKKVELPGLTVYEPSARMLMYLLKCYEKSRRKLYLVNVSEVANRSADDEETAGVTMSVELRSVHWGPPGIYFSGDGSSPPVIASVTNDCLHCGLRDIFLGLEVERLVVPGRSNVQCQNLSAEDLTKMLRTLALFEKRILHLKSRPIDTMVFETVHLDAVGDYIDIQGVMMGEEEEDLIIDGDECVICMEKCKDTVFDPCRHRCACQSCASKLRSCPICRKNIAKQLLIYP